MKKILSFSQKRAAILKRTGSVATITISPLPEPQPLPSILAELADNLDEYEIISVFRIKPPCGEIALTISEHTDDRDLIAAVCAAMMRIFAPTSVVIYDEKYEGLV